MLPIETGFSFNSNKLGIVRSYLKNTPVIVPAPMHFGER